MIRIVRFVRHEESENGRPLVAGELAAKSVP
jgi:hypothetical protein